MATNPPGHYVIADRLAPRLRAAFLRAVAQIQSDLSLADLTAALESGDLARILAAVKVAHLPAALAPAVAVVEAIVTEAAAHAITTLAVDASFTIVNPLAAAAAHAQGAQLVTAITQETAAAIRALTARAVTEGIAPRELATLIRPLVGLTTRQTQAVLNARAAWQDAGLASDVLERKAATYAAKLLKQRAVMIARTECLTGETVIDGAVVRTVFRRWYDGPVAQIVSDRGRQFTATANHPVLTRRGWLGAGELQPGDDLVCDGRQQYTRASGHEHVQARPPTIAQIFDALTTVGVVERRHTRHPDFHGDGREGEVDALCPFWPLSVGMFAPLYQPLIQRVFAPPDESRLPFCAECGRLLSIDQQPCLCAAADRDALVVQHAMSDAIGEAQVLADFRRRLTGLVTAHDVGHGQIAAEVVRLGAAALLRQYAGLRQGPRDAGLFQGVADPRIFGAHRLGDGRDREAGCVEFDRVASVGVRSFAGHVFNLSTPYGYFTANDGIYTGNTIDAANAGQLAAWRGAVQAGLLNVDTTFRIWSAASDARTCERCAFMDEQTVGFDEPFIDEAGSDVWAPTLHPNCLLGESRVQIGDVVAVSDRAYDGPIVVVTTASGNRLACTPNHPILTPRGWVAAALLTKGDDVVSSGRRQWMAIGDEHHDDATPCIDQIANALRGSPETCTLSVEVTAEDFHGDGIGSQIAVIQTQRFLVDRYDAADDEQGGKVALTRTDAQASRLHSQRALLALGDRADATDGGGVALGEPQPLLRAAHSGPQDTVRLTQASGLNAHREQAPSNDRSFESHAARERFHGFAGQVSGAQFGERYVDCRLGPAARPHDHARFAQPQADDSITAGDAQLASDLLAGLAGPVFSDQVIDVERHAFVGHVYNLETLGGYFVAEGIVTHNCRCSVSLVFQRARSAA